MLEPRPEEICRSGETEAPIASEAVRRSNMLFEIERSINGKTPEQRSIRKPASLTCWQGFQIAPPTKSPTSFHGMGKANKQSTTAVAA